MTFEKLKPERHNKGWGYEDWIVNDEKYCGKLLSFEKGKKCSFHYHKIKDEHFFLSFGKILLKLSWEDDITKAQEVILNPGDVFHIEIGMRHQMIALKKSLLYEFSTKHYEDDSYRILKGD